MPTPHKCPICEGTGKVPDLNSTAYEKLCNACSGAGIIWDTLDNPPATPMDSNFTSEIVRRYSRW